MLKLPPLPTHHSYPHPWWQWIGHFRGGHTTGASWAFTDGVLISITKCTVRLRSVGLESASVGLTTLTRSLQLQTGAQVAAIIQNRLPIRDHDVLFASDNEKLYGPLDVLIHLAAIPLGRLGFDILVHGENGTGMTLIFTVAALKMVIRPYRPLSALVP